MTSRCLVSQVVPDALVGEPTRELVLPNEPARLSEIRRFVAHYLADVRAPVDISSEIVLAVSEAAGNAARYGRRQEGRSELRIRCSLAGPMVEIAVADDGGGFDAETIVGPRRAARPLRQRGPGPVPDARADGPGRLRPHPQRDGGQADPGDPAGSPS